MVACTNCRRFLDAGSYNTGDLSACPFCGALIRVDAFPALVRELPPGTPGEQLLVDDDASCFYHPDKKAVMPCNSCGRFLCALCDVELNDEHVCLACLETGKKKKKIQNLENQLTLYDSIALALAVIPVLLIVTVYFTFITAPAAIFMVIYYWKRPVGIIRTRIRFIIAFIAAGLQITGWSVLVFSLVSGW